MRVKGRGIGLPFARRALASGATRIYAGMRETAGFAEPGPAPVRIDVTDRASVEEAARRAGDNTIVVNGAGIAATVPDALDDAVRTCAAPFQRSTPAA